jgi:hypothetical protein
MNPKYDRKLLRGIALKPSTVVVSTDLESLDPNGRGTSSSAARNYAGDDQLAMDCWVCNPNDGVGCGGWI